MKHLEVVKTSSSFHVIEFIFATLKSQLDLIPTFVTGKLEFSEKNVPFSEKIHVIKVILIAEATNAISALTNVKTSVPSIMTDSRLKSIFLL